MFKSLKARRRIKDVEAALERIERFDCTQSGTYGIASRDAVRMIRRALYPPVPCRVSEEWSGSFIGRRYCNTHGKYWDDDGPCPGLRAEMEEIEPIPTLAPHTSVTLAVGQRDEPVEFYVTHIQYDQDRITVSLQDAASMEREYRIPTVEGS